mmetsp:Transcript_6075/g.5999  ORF Transcript_6075/g.5999 Transcript_6075/m.5999 type:complete len:130 (-) Transcript_6075:68-457(-)
MTKFAKDLDSSKQLKAFLEGFYKVSDTKPPVQGDEYVNYFTPEATLIMGANQAKGSDEIRQLRQNIWANVSKRHHVVHNVAAVNDTDFLLNGDVDYVLNDGSSSTKSWGAYIEFESSAQEKMKYYRVYI